MSIALPSFELTLVKKDEEGNFHHDNINLSDFVKTTQTGLILYFYPKDNTPGCTIQANDFSTDLDKFANKGYAIIGVSRDGIKSHENFINKQAITFGLIADTDEKLCQHFDVIKEKTLYGKTALGIVRSTFVFDNQGKLIHEIRNVSAKEHSSQLLSIL